MPDFTWMSEEERLTPAGLTVLAQTISPNDNGALLWDIFMPREDVDQTKLDSLGNVNVRISSDRRQWNARGRYIPMVTPPRKEMQWIPIEAYFRIEEKEINDILNEVRGRMDIFREIIGVRVPQRTRRLVDANYRRFELEVMQAWALGVITIMDPETGQTYEVDYEFHPGRYQTAATPFNDPSVNAYEEFVAWLREGLEQNGPILGTVSRMATRDTIVAAAPNPMPGAQSGLEPTIPQVEALISQRLGTPFRFITIENTVEVFVDGGVTRIKMKTWPEHRIATVPAGQRIGRSAFAPVLRAYDITNVVDDAGIDIRGQTVYHEVAGMGRDFTVEGQVNPMPDPREDDMWVLDAGV
jgi:hypothetical protein